MKKENFEENQDFSFDGHLFRKNEQKLDRKV